MSSDDASGAVLVGQVFLSRVTLADNAVEWSRLVRQVSAARRQAMQPISCCVVLDPNAELPSQDRREDVLRATLALLNYCRNLTFVVSGNSLHTTLLRSALRAAITHGGQAPRVRVVEDFDSAMRLAADPELCVPDIRRAAEQAGVFSPPSPEGGNA